MIARSILLGITIFAGILFLAQHKLIWFPRTYGATLDPALPKTLIELHYPTSAGRQCAFYLPPRDASTEPESIWVLFCGNGSLALDWTDFALRDPHKRDGFLLIDYPGYGRCEGTAEPANINESATRALEQLAGRLGMDRGRMDSKLNALGHSIGAAAALEFATQHPVKRLILLSPFTSLRDMARRTIGWPLCWLLRHNFDNRARLKELAVRETRPRVTIFHGTADTVIPEKMGRSLAESFPKMIKFHEVPDATHDSIVDDAGVQIFAAMNNRSP